MSNIQVLKKLYSLYARHNKRSIQACLIVSLLEGVQPYVLLVLSSVLIEGMISGADFMILLMDIAVGLAVNFIMLAAIAREREVLNSSIENCLERENRDLNEVSMQIDYENLENQEKQEKQRRHEQLVNTRGGIYWMTIWPLDKGGKAIVNIISALVIAVPMFMKNGNVNASGFWASPIPAIILVIFVAFCLFSGNKISIVINNIQKKIFDKYSNASKLQLHICHNILSGNESGKDLRIFNQEDMIQNTCLESEKEVRGYLEKSRKLYMLQNASERTFSNLCLIAVYLYAAVKAYLGYISISNVVLYASSIVKCIDSLQYLSWAIAGWNQAAEFGRDYLDYLNFDNNQYKGSIPTEKRRDNRFLLEFDHVSFKYPGSDAYVIKDLSLTLDIGEKMAIVGKNGSGKTTFIKLICRLYDVTEGEIRLNGIDIRKYDYDEYMALISVVFQDYRMFSLQLGENIAASEEVDEKKALSALEKAGLSERMKSLRDGLATYVGKEFDNDGVSFSGGERQKMAIARAIYKDAPFVIMDEPTAALDPLSECEVYAGFDKMVGSKTALYISHRLASCRFCEDILVFDKGQIVQRGSHEKLVAEEGLYQALWNAQAKYYA